MKTTKISLEAFKGTELTVNEKKLIMAGSGTTVSVSGATSCTGTDHDGLAVDND